MSESGDLEARIEALYGLPPAGFVAARTALAKALRAEKQADAAQRVSGLRRPAAAAAAINRAAREKQSEVIALIAADERLRRAQGASPDPAELRAAMQAHRERLRGLAEIAAGHLPGASTAGQLRAIQATLQAAAAGDAALRDRLLRGMLDEELEAPGFDALAGLSPAARPRPAEVARTEPPAEAIESAQPAAATRATARAEAALARAARAAERERARTAASERAAAERRAAASEKRAARLADRAAGLAAQVEAARASAEAARRDADAARREAEADRAALTNKQS